MSDEEEEYSLMDWVGTAIGIVVAGFIIFILIWPLIDPTPNKSSTLKENIQNHLEFKQKIKIFKELLPFLDQNQEIIFKKINKL